MRNETEKKKEILVHLTAKDFEFTYSMGTGPGGQKRNKTSSKVRCFHRASGAEGISDETRSQHKNKELAFSKMAHSEKFQKWLKLEAARKMGKLRDIDEKVEAMMRPENIRVEVQKDGKWVPESEASDDSDRTS